MLVLPSGDAAWSYRPLRAPWSCPRSASTAAHRRRVQRAPLPGGRPAGSIPLALALALGTVVVGAELIHRIQADGWGPQNQANPVHGFEEPWVQPLLAFNVAFLALLFLVQAWQASRSSGDNEREDDSAVEWLIRPFAGGGPPFLL
jgi:hypothetical protein